MLRERYVALRQKAIEAQKKEEKRKNLKEDTKAFYKIALSRLDEEFNINSTDKFIYATIDGCLIENPIDDTYLEQLCEAEEIKYNYYNDDRGGTYVFEWDLRTDEEKKADEEAKNNAEILFERVLSDLYSRIDTNDAYDILNTGLGLESLILDISTDEIPTLIDNVYLRKLCYKIGIGVDFADETQDYYKFVVTKRRICESKQMSELTGMKSDIDKVKSKSKY